MTGRRPARVARWTAFAVWAAAVWILSSRPDPAADLGWRWPVPDKVVHGAVFAVGGFLAAAACATTSLRSPALAAVVLCALWGFTDEVHQGFVPGRSTETGDLVADVTGAALGAALHAGLSRRSVLRARGSR